MESAQLDEFEWMTVMWLDEEAKMKCRHRLTYLPTEFIIAWSIPPDPASVEWPKIRKRSVHPELAVLSRDRHCG